VLSRRKVAVEEVLVSKNSRKLDYRFRAVEEIRDGNVGSEVMCIEFWLRSWEWLNLPRKNT